MLKDRKMASAENSINFLRKILRFCEACATRGYITEGIEADYAGFGSWSIRLGTRVNGRDSIVLAWDGREGRLTIKKRVPEPSGIWPLKAVAEMDLETSKGEDPFTHCLQFLDR